MKRSSIYILFSVFVVGFVLYGRSKMRSGKGEPQVKQKEVESAAPRKPYKETVRVADFREDFVAPNFDEYEFVKSRNTMVVKFVDKAVEHLQKNELSRALSDFSHNEDFVKGELYIFVFDYDGVCLAHGQDSHLIWEPMFDYQDKFGSYPVEGFIEKAKKGGGWLTYVWRNAAKVSYVRGIVKDGKRLVVGAGYYPMSKRDSVVELVRASVDHFNKSMVAGASVSDAFSELNYPLGKFVLGDLYIFALDFEGDIWAQGDKPGVIGANAFNRPDQEGKLINQEIIKKLEKSDNGVWIEYKTKGTKKLAYAEKVTDKKGNNYFIAAGYYPRAGRKDAFELVKRGYAYMKMHGLTEAKRAFTNKKRDDYRFGDLWLFVYDYEGNCRAHGKNPDYVGAPRFNEKDQDGKYYVQEMIEKAKDGGGWVTHKLKNRSRFVYVEPINLGDKTYVVGSGIYPISKPEVVYLLAKRAASLLETNPKDEVLKKIGEFVFGDLKPFVFDSQGICYAYGSDSRAIWKDFYNEKDQDGRQFVKLFINTAKEGSGNVVYKVNNAYANAYVIGVDKAEGFFVVGISFFI